MGLIVLFASTLVASGDEFQFDSNVAVNNISIQLAAYNSGHGKVADLYSVLDWMAHASTKGRLSYYSKCSDHSNCLIRST